jgi:predicted phosphoribosyltransferase
VTNRIYDDFESAGLELAVALAKHGDREPIVLAIANSGVPVAVPVADSSGAQLDLVVIRRLFVREGAIPITAVNVAGTLVIDEDSKRLSSVEVQFKQDAIGELSNRVNQMRGVKSSLSLEGKDVVLVDNGIHTGSTAHIAIKAVRQLKPRSITIATPVANELLKATIKSVADEVVCLQWCDPFGNTAVWYKNFNRPGDEQIKAMLQNRRLSTN